MAFFTHCGMHGVMEAVRFAVPMVGLPVAMDQHDVLRRLQERGVARELSKDASEQEIYETVLDVVTNPRCDDARSYLLQYLQSNKKSACIEQL